MAGQKRDTFQGTLDMLVLKALQLEPMHGWGITERIEQWSEQVFQLGQGTLYPALYRLERQGLIRSEWKVTSNNRTGAVLRAHQGGPTYLADELAHWRRLSRAINLILDATVGQLGRTHARTVAAPEARSTTGARTRRGGPLSHRSADREEHARRHDPGRGATAGVRQVRRRRIPQGAHARRVPAGVPRGLSSRRALRRPAALPVQGLRDCRHPDARRWASAPPRRFSAWSTACCSGPLPYPDPDRIVRLYPGERQRAPDQFRLGAELRGLEVRHAQLQRDGGDGCLPGARDHRRRSDDDSRRRRLARVLRRDGCTAARRAGLPA